MPIRFTVGQLAKLSHLSKQTLIYYDRQGVFSPATTDPHNGYRYYTADQLEVLDSILMLKEIGLSLAEIRSFMAQRSAINALSMLRQQHTRLTQRLRSLSLVAARLAHKIQTLEQRSAHSGAPQWVYLAQPQPMFVQTVSPPCGLLEVDLSVNKLFRRAQTSNALHFYQIGTMIAAQDLQAERFLKASYTFFPLEEDAGGAQRYRPMGWHLRCFHTGPYESVGETYRKLLHTMVQQGCKPCGYSYEYCVLDSLTSKESADYVTEIYLPACGHDGAQFVPKDRQPTDG